MYWLQLCRIDDLIVLEVVDSSVADEIEIIAENCPSCRIAHQVGAILESLATAGEVSKRACKTLLALLLIPLGAIGMNLTMRSTMWL